MSGSARRTPQALLLTDDPHIDDYKEPDNVLSLDEAYAAAGTSYSDMILTEVDLSRQLARATDSTDRAHIARTLDQSHEL